MTRFNKLNVPSHWEHYWSKYPEGYTIMEALISWVSQVDKMVDNVNDWNEYLEKFSKSFDKDLEGTVSKLLREWQRDGTLDFIINEAIELEIAQKANSTNHLNRFFQKLRSKESVTITMQGDSMFYGSDFNSNGVIPADPNPADNGARHTATRARMTAPMALQRSLREVFGNVTVVNKGFSGDGTKRGYEHWNPSRSDVIIFHYGINDGSNSSIDYMGNISEFLRWYRLLIKRELNNGTGVILMTPTKQRNLSPSDVDSRVHVDIYRNAVLQLAREYNVPTIDGKELMAGYSASIFSDGTHFNDRGYEIMGCRMASPFIGTGLLDPYKIGAEGFQGAAPYQHSVNFKGTTGFITSPYYPSASEHTEGNGSAVVINDSTKAYFSVYTENDNMVVIPSLFSNQSDTTFRLSLDFGVENADYNNDYNFGRPAISNAEPAYPPSKVDFPFSSYTNGVYSSKYGNGNNYLMIPHKGWHTIVAEVTTAGGTATVHGLEYSLKSLHDSRTGTTINVPMGTGVTPFYPVSPIKARKFGAGVVSIEGTLNIPTERPVVLGTLPPDFRPNYNRAMTIALSTSSGGGYGVVAIKQNGDIELVFTSISVGFCSLNNLTYQIQT